jgi:hypothetical protein
LPERVNVEDISRMKDVKDFWRSGIRKIEEMFAEHCSKMTVEIESKAGEYEQVRDKLVKNHDWLH